MKQDEDRLNLHIDLNRLDDEWNAQSQLYRDKAEEMADARLEFDEAEAHLEIIRAQTATKIRRDPEDYEMTKTTEASINETVIQQDIFREAQQELFEARHILNRSKGDLAALDHHKSALSKLVDLFLANYFSRPIASSDAKERMGNVEKRSVRRKGIKNRGD